MALVMSQTSLRFFALDGKWDLLICGIQLDCSCWGLPPSYGSRWSQGGYDRSVFSKDLTFVHIYRENHGLEALCGSLRLSEPVILWLKIQIFQEEISVQKTEVKTSSATFSLWNITNKTRNMINSKFTMIHQGRTYKYVFQVYLNTGLLILLLRLSLSNTRNIPRLKIIVHCVLCNY